VSHRCASCVRRFADDTPVSPKPDWEAGFGRFPCELSELVTPWQKPYVALGIRLKRAGLDIGWRSDSKLESKTVDNNSYWRDRYGFPRDWGRIEFGFFANWVMLVIEEADPETGEVIVNRVRAYLDREGNPRWYSLLDNRGQVLQRSETSWFVESQCWTAWLIDYFEGGFNFCPGPYTPFVAVARWLRTHVCPKAAEVLSASQIPGGWANDDVIPGATPSQIQLNRLISEVRFWAFHCYQREPREPVDHRCAWVGYKVDGLPFNIQLVARDVKSLWGQTIDAREMEHVHGDYWLIRDVFVRLWEYPQGRAPDRMSRGFVGAMRDLDVKFRLVSDADIFLRASDRLRVVAESTADS
jgi:hypothetical protein